MAINDGGPRPWTQWRVSTIRSFAVALSREVLGRGGILVVFTSTLFHAFAADERRSADPAYYIKRATWQETMLASADAITRAVPEDGFPAFESETVRGGEPARQISINVAGANELWLFVTGCPDVKWGVADWAEARLIRKDGTSESLTAAKNFKAVLGRHETNLTLRSGLYQKMRIGGRQFERGLHVQANSAVVAPLDGEFEKFEAWIGVDAWAGTNGTVRFSVVGARSAARKRLWEFVARDFADELPRRQIAWEREDRIYEREWQPGDFAALAARYARASERVPPIAEPLTKFAAHLKDRDGLAQARALFYRSRELDAALAEAKGFDFEALRLAIEDLERTFAEKYPKRFSARLREVQSEIRAVIERAFPARNDQSLLTSAATKTGVALAEFERVEKLVRELKALKREALLANPLLDFEQLLVIKRRVHGEPRRSQWEGYGLGEFIGVPRQSSWGHGTMPNVDKWTNEIAVLSPARPDGKLTTLFKPDDTHLVTDVDLHFDGDKLLFAMPDKRKQWQVFELRCADEPTRSADFQSAVSQISNLQDAGKAEAVRGADALPTASRRYSRLQICATPELRQLTPSDHPDVHNYDPCYLPSGKILFLSTAPLQGVPCNAGVIVGMMYRMDADGQNIRQVTFEQDHDYNPSVMNDGRVLYLRWDYTDTPHIWNRILFTMNPDGTSQFAYYGGSSYWPNSVFYPRAIPGHATKIAGIVTGHHEGRVGELVIFDPSRGTQETDGVVQRIPGRGKKVEARLEDKLTEHSWPKFLHPWPLSEKHFLVAGKPEPDSLWGIYLVDVFDNMTLLKEEEGWALLEPIPFRPRPAPPVIPEKLHTNRTDALVYMEDVYFGPGLKDVPRGTVKSLRVFAYHFGFQTLAGIDHRVGADGPWETKRVLGTVPVEADGSAWFRIPAQTPISIQPLDGEGKAVALMRSWMTAQPGENLSCVGCHERSSAAPPGMKAMALKRAPSDIAPWRGPARGFSFAREVQPVLDRHCVRCHNGEARADGEAIVDLRADQNAFVVYAGGRIDGQVIRGVSKRELLGKFGAVFEPSYVALRQFVRVGGLESDLHLLPPKEFHADTSELIQMLRKGHYDVQLDAEAWDRLVTWIDLNAPCHGVWREVTKLPGNQRERRLELRKLYGGVVQDCEAEREEDPVAFVSNVKLANATKDPFRPADAATHAYAQAAKNATAPSPAGWPLSAEEARAKQAALGAVTRTIDLGGVKMDFIHVPAGEFVMGDAAGFPDEQRMSVVRIEQPFWIARCEVSNEQFAQFDSSHDSRFEHRSSWIFSEEYLGWPLNKPQQPVVRVSWNEAMAFCRWLSEKLGEHVTLPTEAQWEYACRAGTATPLSFGDLDTDFARFANLGDVNLRRIADEGWRPKAPDLIPRDSRFNDGALVTAAIGQYQPNAWGLHDMHGNAAEWTRSSERDGSDLKVVRGGSWRDRPKLCRSASRLAYSPWQKVFNVGFRVVIESDAKDMAATKQTDKR